MSEDQPSSWGRESRKERREARRATAKRSKALNMGDNSNWNVALWFLAAFMALALFLLAPKIGRGVTVVVLVAMFASLVHPVWQLQAVRTAPGRNIKAWRFVGFMVVVSLLIALFGIWVWPPIRRHALNKKEISSFKSGLGGPSTKVKQTVQIACPENDESVCVYASQFVQYFGEMGWDVKGKVERVSLARPKNGVVLVERGGDQKKAFDWNTGGWTAMTPDLESIYRAFRSVEITPDGSSGPFVEDGMIVVWFGEEREDESADTGLTTAMENMQKRREQYPPDGIPPGAKQDQP